jgi:hypothetical protein
MKQLSWNTMISGCMQLPGFLHSRHWHILVIIVENIFTIK